MAKFDATMEWLARTYVHAMNCIHYMHDKYFYERLEMALHDRDILRTMAFGIAGLSVVADSLSAIKHAKVHVIRDDNGLVVDYRIEGDFPTFGNADSRGGRHRGRSRLALHEQDPQAPDLSQRGAHAVGADHHLQRRLRQDHRQHARRPAQGRALRARAPIRCTGATATAGSPPASRSPGCPTPMRRTASATPSAIAPSHGAARRRGRRSTMR